MLLHVARHGQVSPPAPGEVEDVDYPKNDRSLSDLGCLQAQWLGRRLLESGFYGTIYSSPFIRTVQTAQIIGDLVDCPIELCAAIREAVIVPERTVGFRGATPEELMARFSRVRPPADLPYPWWDNRKECGQDVVARVGPFVERLARSGEREALLVGHGSSVQAVIKHVLATRSPQDMDKIPPTKPWNCALTSMRLLPEFELLAMVCTRHIPEEGITSNKSQKADVLRRYHERQAAKATRHGQET